MAYNSRRFSPAQEAILTTLLYSDIFSFPLTKDELWKFLITKKKISRQDFDNSLKILQKQLFCKNGFYCLKGREKIIPNRIANATEVEKKMKKARYVSEKLSRISSIQFIGISGGLAVENVTRKDDIDLIIIVRKNTLFMSRLLILGVLETLGVRRSRTKKNTADTICVNLLFDETVFSWFVHNQDIYLAREITQIVPLFEKEGIYRKFLNENKWIENYLPNVTVSKGGLQDLRMSPKESIGLKIISQVLTNPLFEAISRSIQISWMKPHQTTEIVDKHVLAFHPNDYRTKTLKQLRLKMRQLGLLTNF